MKLQVAPQLIHVPAPGQGPPAGFGPPAQDPRASVASPILSHCSWAPGPPTSLQVASVTPNFGVCLFAFLFLGWEKVTVKAEVASELPEPRN